MKIHRDLGVRQSTPWFLMQRIREGFQCGSGLPLPGPIEADETYIGGRRKNMPKNKQKELTGRGAVGKVAVAGVKDRETKVVTAQAVQNTDAKTLQGFVTDNTDEGAIVYTDEAKAYKGIERTHKSVNHSADEYVRGDVHTNGIESFWSLLKRGFHGTFHHFSEKHLDRYVTEFAGRHNIRDLNTIDQMAFLARGMVGKKLKYDELVSD